MIKSKKIEDGKRLSSSKESVTSWLNELGY